MQWKDEVVMSEWDDEQIETAYRNYKALNEKEKNYLIQIKGL